MRRPRRVRRLSLTSLIDVIFLLLLFFMLSSTFTRFAEIELSAAGAAPLLSGDERPLFLQLGADRLSLGGRPVTLGTLAAALREAGGEGAAVLVAPQDGVTAQRLADTLVALRAVPGLRVTVLGGA